MADTETIDQIVAAADEARQALFSLELDLQKEIDQIRFIAFQEDRALTDEEKTKRTQLRASQSEIREAHIELAYVTATRLDDSTEVKHLKKRMDELNRGLADDLAELKKIETLAAKVARVADTVAKIVEKVATKAASIVA